MALDESDLSITFQNLTEEAWQLDAQRTQYSATAGKITEEPSETLKANAGTEVLALSESLSDLARADSVLEVVWRSPSGVRIGVRLESPVQVFTLGPSPHWKVMYDRIPGRSATPSEGASRQRGPSRRDTLVQPTPRRRGGSLQLADRVRVLNHRTTDKPTLLAQRHRPHQPSVGRTQQWPAL